MKNFVYFDILVQAMEKISVSDKLLFKFRAEPQTLIFEGYCRFVSGVTLYNEGEDYALLSPFNNGASVHCCLYSANTEFIDKVVNLFKCDTAEFCAVSPFVTEYLKTRFDFEWETNCDLFVWNGKPLKREPKCKIGTIGSDYAQTISDGTHYHADLDDIKKCLLLHPSAAAYVDGKPVCWCLLHQEGSLGMLYTVPEYRRRGYALEVMTALVQQVVERGDVPFAYIVRDNVASQNLAAKYNMEKVCRADYFEINLNGSKQNQSIAGEKLCGTK